MYDIIVVGGGPAGMTAALYALRNGKRVLVLEKNGFGGQIAYSPKVENYPGSLQLSGSELAERMLDQILAQGAEVELEKAVFVDDRGDHKTVRTEEGGAYDCRALILAPGVKHRLLGLPGEEELIGSGISFCAVCDGDFYRDQTVCVAGGGNSALQEAILLADKCRQVILLQDLPEFTGEKRLQELLFRRPNVRARVNVRITGLALEEGQLVGLETEDRITGQPIPEACDGLFVAVGLIPENEAFSGLARLDDFGYFASDESCTTASPGVFVAGDCRSKRVRQVTTANADGAVAAIAACRYIDGM